MVDWSPVASSMFFKLALGTGDVVFPAGGCQGSQEPRRAWGPWGEWIHTLISNAGQEDHLAVTGCVLRVAS